MSSPRSTAADESEPDDSPLAPRKLRLDTDFDPQKFPAVSMVPTPLLPSGSGHMFTAEQLRSPTRVVSTSIVPDRPQELNAATPSTSREARDPGDPRDPKEQTMWENAQNTQRASPTHPSQSPRHTAGSASYPVPATLHTSQSAIAPVRVTRQGSLFVPKRGAPGGVQAAVFRSASVGGTQRQPSTVLHREPNSDSASTGSDVSDASDSIGEIPEEVYLAADFHGAHTAWSRVKFAGKGSFSDVVLARPAAQFVRPEFAAQVAAATERELRGLEEPPMRRRSSVQPIPEMVKEEPVPAVPTEATLMPPASMPDTPEETPAGQVKATQVNTAQVNTGEAKTGETGETPAGGTSDGREGSASLLVAVKITTLHPGKAAAQLEYFRRDLEIMQHLPHHPSLMRLIGYSIDETTFHRALFVLPYCAGGDLFDLVSRHRSRLSSMLLRRLFVDVCSAVVFLHGHNIVHRDIKLENVLLDVKVSQLLGLAEPNRFERPLAVLTDLGLARRINPEAPLLSTRCGSDDYVPPEIMLGQPYDGRETDSWALGVLLYAMLEGRLPFDAPPHTVQADANRARLRTAHRIARVEWTWYKRKDATPEWQGGKDVVDGCLRRRATRSSPDDIMRSPWVHEALPPVVHDQHNVNDLWELFVQ